MSHQENITRIRAVRNALGDLKDDVVFVGGATVSLYTDRRTEDVRPTDDIDVVIEILAYKDYAAIDERLRKLGFVNDQESRVICRYKIHGIIVDPKTKNPNISVEVCGVGRDRTGDTRIFSPLLYRLSYRTLAFLVPGISVE